MKRELVKADPPVNTELAFTPSSRCRASISRPAHGMLILHDINAHEAGPVMALIIHAQLTECTGAVPDL